MKTSYLKLIILLLGITSLGLLGVQFYWLTEIRDAAQERFGQEVRQVLSRVVMLLERQEAVIISKELLEKQNDMQMLGKPQGENTTDSLSRDSLQGDSTKFLLNIELVYADGNFQVYPKSLSPAYNATQIEGANPAVRHFKQYQRKLDFINAVLQRVNESEQPIENRVSYTIINSLLQKELKQKNLNLKYEFALVDNQTQQVFYASSTSPQFKWDTTPWKVRLFPNDLRIHENYLYVIFPEEKSYVTADLISAMFTGGVFVLIMVACFGVVIWTVFQQKRNSEVVNDFISNMTHEFKTPISTIRLVCDMLKEPLVRQNEEKYKHYLSMAESENKRLETQVQRVLDMAKLDKKEYKLKITTIDVHELIEGIVDSMQIQIAQRNGFIASYLDAEQPLIEADAVHLRSMLMTLLDNANKYSPTAPDIAIQTQNIKNGIEIRISDKGQGIAKKHLVRIFEKFYRVPTGNLHDVKGFGLGLAYVKMMAAAHHGTVSAESEGEGKGSTFVLFLPYQMEKD
ncbi:sensor histidine kinase [Hugenholtzia roseola]|uniref:sensor histidine kinase n=1 Tax=Hugenholtzia roseola TaxID=1002 RepID=UPI000402BB92|nr:HAMP domain-containing sensor histidine kinase [Hugenholtzia roseola]